ncbi:uncharacterized protein LOC111358581 [Spodoptera litura]|uniref:Uncharacterized protein LOC111358581 n=1 Tax=Spodoptera litura TaxID=69820 RepID=A0A9J7IWE2_SPOLT|nr:uncharacterized protein LOC111358581 [Spodoptera litura]
MSKLLQISQHEKPQNIRAKLPTTVILNPRAKIGGRKVVSENVEDEMGEEEYDIDLHFEIKTAPCQEEPILPPQPIPKFPLHVAWCPNTLCFVLDEDQVTHRLWITNRSKRTIYLHCCGLWNDTVRYGASWCCFPRTRIWLPPGLRAALYVRATPRDIISPFPDAVTFMQIAAAHLRDNVTGYFSIPIKAKFLKYIAPPMAEGE